MYKHVFSETDKQVLFDRISDVLQKMSAFMREDISEAAKTAMVFINLPITSTILILIIHSVPLPAGL